MTDLFSDPTDPAGEEADQLAAGLQRDAALARAAARELVRLRALHDAARRCRARLPGLVRKALDALPAESRALRQARAGAQADLTVEDCLR